MMFLYDVLFFVFALVYLPIFFLKGKHRTGLRERFGRVPKHIQEELSGKEVFWLHAVSVGEVVLAVRFAAAIKKRNPEVQIVLTTTTLAGHDVAKKTKDDGDVLLFFPVDFKWAVQAFINSVSPKAVIILETEIWPNLITELTRKNIPVFIINGRLSDKGINAYQRARFFLKPILQKITGVGVQDKNMRERFISLGADPSRIRVTGNLKYDVVPNSAGSHHLSVTMEHLKQGAPFWLVAGSTHENEEESLMEAYGVIKKRFPDLRLLIAPRHLQRIASIQAKAAEKNVALKTVSRLAQNGKSGDGMDSVLLLDQMGALQEWYQLADAVFVGGSLVSVGGHNLVEPALLEKPILFGPYMQNFTEMATEFQKQGAAIQVRDIEDFKKQLMWLYENKEERSRMGSAAKRFVLSHQGAIQKNIDMVWGGLKS